jgi:hypothetical protein
MVSIILDFTSFVENSLKGYKVMNSLDKTQNNLDKDFMSDSEAASAAASVILGSSGDVDLSGASLRGADLSGSPIIPGNANALAFDELTREAIAKNTSEAVVESNKIAKDALESRMDIRSATLRSNADKSGSVYLELLGRGPGISANKNRFDSSLRSNSSFNGSIYLDLIGKGPEDLANKERFEASIIQKAEKITDNDNDLREDGPSGPSF